MDEQILEMADQILAQTLKNKELLDELMPLFYTIQKDAARYRKIKAISQKHMGIDIFENDGVVDVFHTGLDAGHKAPTFDQAIDEVAE